MTTLAKKTKAKAGLSTFTLMMMTVVSVDSLRNLPTTALFGSALIFFFIMATIFFLLPSALVSAELASGWPKQGGVYVWVKEALGERFGFFAIWLQWIENIIWYPTILSFVAGTLGYLFYPDLAHHRFFLFLVILAVFWGATWINCLGIKSSARFSTLCSLGGLILPMLVIILLGVSWLLGGHPLAIHLSWGSIVPNFSNHNVWISLTGILMSFCGMELATAHARDVAEPQRTFPIALLGAAAIILFTLLFGSLSIAMVVPVDKISLTSGIMQAFDVFLSRYHLHYLLPVAAVMLIIGGIGNVSNWIISPVKGILVALQDRGRFSALCKENKQQAPQRILIMQAVLVSLLAMVFLFLPTVNSAYWLLTALAAQLYMMMYLLMFISAIILRHKQAGHQRLFRVPGGRYWGMWLVAGLGCVGSAVTWCIAFIPPEQIWAGRSFISYIALILAGLLLMSLPPFLIKKKKK